MATPSPTTPGRAEAIARSLRPAEASMVLSLSRTAPTPASALPSLDTAGALHRAGLAFLALGYATLTPLGGEVQECLRRLPA